MRRGALPTLATTLASHGRRQVDIGAELAALQAPVQVVCGLEDRIIPWHHATHAGPGIPVFFIPHAGHMPHRDQPQQVAALLG